MKNVLVVNSSGHVGGAEKILLTFLKNVDGDAFNFFWIIPTEEKLSKLLKDNGIRFETIEGLYERRFVTRDDSIFSKPILTMNSISNILRFSDSISEYVKRQNIDILISCGVKASIAGGLAARRNGITSIWLIQDILPDNLFRSAFTLCAKIFPERIIVISNAIRDTFPKYLHKKIETVYPFLEREELEKASSPHPLRKELKIEDDEVLLGVIGKLFPSKGIDIFLKAFSKMEKANKNIRALIVGDAGLEVIDSTYMDALKRLADSLGIEDRVIFLDWRDEVYDILNAIDILIYTPKRPFGFGRVLIEAMACSKPVVAFGYDDVSEIIEDGISGISVEPMDEDALITRLEDLIHNKELREQLGKSARGRVEALFSEAVSGNRFNDLLKELYL